MDLYSIFIYLTSEVKKIIIKFSVMFPRQMLNSGSLSRCNVNPWAVFAQDDILSAKSMKPCPLQILYVDLTDCQG